MSWWFLVIYSVTLAFRSSRPPPSELKLYKIESTKQFHNSKIKLPLVFKKVQPPTRKLKTTYKASRPNLFVLVKSIFEIFDVSFSVCKDSSVDTL
ncbi:60S ribosomal protein L18a-2 [Artemisia annua]|uniref:60S ribosomal protein L18a-2 n=1 Tax=Artemisia annua TaxID=35608 RepID=A0A2U1MY28_ARTAN|nr:60S ribosomal protein L18a-2 [Artemisia annua]